MSDDTPLQTFFQLQRETIRQSEELMEAAFEAPRELSEMSQSGTEAHRQMGSQALELSRRSIHQSLDAAESVPGDEPGLDSLRETVDETFDTLEAQQTEAFESLDDGYEQMTAETLENLGGQVDLLLEFNEQIEDQLVKTLDQMIEQAEEVDELSAGFEEQLEDLTEQFQAQADRFADLQDRFEELDAGDE